MTGLSVYAWLNMSPRMTPEEAEQLAHLKLSVYFPPNIQKKLLAINDPLQIDAKYRRLLRDVAEGNIRRLAVTGMWDTNDRTRTGVALSIARLHAAGLVDLNGCPGKWHLTEAGRQLFAEIEQTRN